MTNKHKGDEFTNIVKKYLYENSSIKLNNEYKLKVGFSKLNKKNHAFDLGNNTMVVECKAYEWTKSFGIPSGKISTLNESMMYFMSIDSQYTKMLFIKKSTLNEKTLSETLAQYYVRLNKHFIPDDIEVYEFDTENMVIHQIHNKT